MINTVNWSQFNKGVFLVNVLGIIYQPTTNLILIGRRENDPYIKELSWSFPGGRADYGEDLEYYLGLEIKKKTGLEVAIKDLVFAKTYPEKREFLSIYYHCEPTGGQEQAGDNLVELKWIKPTEVGSYFTTSIHPKILDYLKTLE
ncbi:MAG: NUDIX domain-containing protein [Candidatus Komeilibacteria bacterium]|nr:NUDIX domain-containing protein [Candidatus Komeilibacteria bacterium]